MPYPDCKVSEQQRVKWTGDAYGDLRAWLVEASVTLDVNLQSKHHFMNFPQ